MEDENIWLRNPLTVNPYTRTAFRVARVNRDVTRRATLVHKIIQTRQIVNADPDLHRIKGEPVKETDITKASEILQNPSRRIAEELLHHAKEAPPLEIIRRFQEKAIEILSRGDCEPVEERNFRGLISWVDHIVSESLSTDPAPDPSFGAGELGLTPPYGHPEVENDG